jgi:hypothetical protein
MKSARKKVKVAIKLSIESPLARGRKKCGTLRRCIFGIEKNE